nr:MAG TPA: hypothetical protein [Caudoviricetes sp.]
MFLILPLCFPSEFYDLIYSFCLRKHSNGLICNNICYIMSCSVVYYSVLS